MSKNDVSFLDDFLDDARTSDVSLSSDLMSRVLLDAQELQTQTRPLEQKRVSIWSQLLEVIGGWPALGGVAAAGVAGLWLGLAPTVAIDGFATQLFGETTSVLFIQDFEMIAEDALDG